MAEAVAGAGVLISAPILGSVNIVQNIQQQINQYVLETYKAILGGVRDVGKGVSDVVERGVTASALSVRGAGSLLARGLAYVYRIGKFSISTMMKVLSKAVGSPESIVVAVVMYRVVDFAISVERSQVEKLFDEFISNFESMSIQPPTVSLPRVSLEGVARAVDAFLDGVKKKVVDIRMSLSNPITDRVIEEKLPSCGPQPEWYEAHRWISYGLCQLGRMILAGLLYLLKFLLDGLIGLAKAVLVFVEYLIDFVKWISVILIGFIESAVNAVIGGFEFFVNGFLQAVFGVANIVFEVFVKKPVVFVARYVLRPLAVAVVDAFRFVRDGMKAILCDYLKLAPFALGFRFVVNSIPKAGLFGSFFGSLVAVAASVAFIGMFVPECAVQPVQAEPLVSYPVQPQAVEAPIVVRYSAVAVVGVAASDVPRVGEAWVWRASAGIAPACAEGLGLVAGRVYDGSAFVGAGAEESVEWSASSGYSGSASVSISVAE